MEKHWDYDWGVLGVPVARVLLACESRVAGEQTLVHIVDIHVCFE